MDRTMEMPQILENSMLTPVNKVDIELTTYDLAMHDLLKSLELPHEKVICQIRERQAVLRNLEYPLSDLEIEKRHQSYYLSKFIVAVMAGLFDAAINYLWDETVLELRYRVSQYDIQYFYDVAVQSPERRSKLKDVEDLQKIDDSELIHACKEIGLISEVGYRHLDYIKYMRNHASAAHPNNVELTGLNLVAWLQTCIKEVFILPDETVTIEIRKLLNNIKKHKISSQDASAIAAFAKELQRDRLNSLISGLFGMYTRKETSQETKNNILLLVPDIWTSLDEQIKSEIGTKYARFKANNDQDQANSAREFLDIVDGQQYIPDPLRSFEIKDALEALRLAHMSSMDNFYKEPPMARNLLRLTGKNEVPVQIEYDYVHTIVEVFLSNGYGVCWDANDIYIELINNFNQSQLKIAIFSFEKDSISSKLQFQKCRDKFDELLTILSNKVTSPSLHEFISKIKEYKNYDKLSNDDKMKQVTTNYKKLIGME